MHHYRQDAGVPFVLRTMDPNDVSIFRRIVLYCMNGHNWMEGSRSFQVCPEWMRCDAFGCECTSVCLFTNKASGIKGRR